MQRHAFAAFLAYAMVAASAADAGDRDVDDRRGHEVPVAVSKSAGAAAAADVPVAPESAAPTRPASMEEICAMLVASAEAHQLPLPFFVRLIWQESRLRSNAVSWAGARGIAQFMPGTAEWRGLTDPHDPIQSLYKSAGYLVELWAQFGNLGLAAAAYNGGSGRVQAWLEGRGGLPAETRHYVHIVTGVPVDRWREPENDLPIATSRIPASIPCPSLIAAVPAQDLAGVVPPARLRSAVDETRTPRSGGWSVIVAGDPSRERARAQFAKVQREFSSILGSREPTIVSKRVPARGPMPVTTISINEPDRASANRLCTRLRASGGSCVVMRAS
jgi:hypothetical protein